MEETKRKWKLKDAARIIKEILVAIGRGELLLRLDIGRFLFHILLLFFLLVMAIWLSLGIDSRMSRVESNRDVIEALQIEKSRKEFEVMSIYRRSTMEKILEESGSKLRERQKPAIRLEKDDK